MLAWPKTVKPLLEGEWLEGWFISNRTPFSISRLGRKKENSTETGIKTLEDGKRVRVYKSNGEQIDS